MHPIKVMEAIDQEEFQKEEDLFEHQTDILIRQNLREKQYQQSLPYMPPVINALGSMSPGS